MPDRLQSPSFFFQIENYRGPEARMRGLRRYVWLRTALEGRRAAKAALNAGCDTICMYALGHAVFLPRTGKAKYFIYGDSTLKQLDKLYYNEEWDNTRKRFFRRHLTKLAKDGHTFLCMSNWYRQGVMQEYGVPHNQAILLRPPIDTETWTPGEQSRNGHVKLLFIGGDFERKGGSLLLDLAADPDLPQAQWHFVTRYEGPTDERVRFYNDLSPDTPELVQLVRSCDLLVLPTQADCYSHAAIEAAACGLPAVITDVGGIADIVQTGVNGALLQQPTRETVKQTLLGYITDPDRRITQGKNARDLAVQRFEARLHAKQLAEALNA